MTTCDRRETVQNPHDKLFREIYSRKEEAQSFLEQYLPAEVLQHIDPGSLEICKDSFVDEEFKDYYSDLLYTVTLHRQPGYVYVLFEHKSYPDRLIHLQLLEYMVKIWRLYLKQRANTDQKGTPIRLPLILPLVLYHGENSWPYSIRFSNMLTSPKEELSVYIPDFTHVLTDLTTYSDDEIRGSVASRVMLLLFKHIFDPDLHHKLPDILKLLNDVVRQERGLQVLELFLRYLSNATGRLTHEELVTIVKQAVEQQGGTPIMTIVEQIRQEAYEQGIKELESRRNEILEEVRKKGVEQGTIIGEILFAQKMMKLSLFEKTELEKKSLENLKGILASMEAQIQKQNEKPE